MASILTNEQRLAMPEATKGLIDVVIDSDTYNEIDDQFAIAYALKRPDRLNVQAIYAAPGAAPSGMWPVFPGRCTMGSASCAAA